MGKYKPFFRQTTAAKIYVVNRQKYVPCTAVGHSRVKIYDFKLWIQRELPVQNFHASYKISHSESLIIFLFRKKKNRNTTTKIGYVLVLTNNFSGDN